MAMQAESLEVLEKANVPSGQARAIVRAIEIEIGGAARDALATKSDILLLRQETADMHRGLEVRIESSYGELGLRLERFRGDLETKIENSYGELGLRLERFRGDLETKIEAAARDNLRHMYGALLAMMGLTLTSLYFMIAHLAH